MRVQGILVGLYFYLIFPANIIGLWWAVGSPLVMDPNSICRKSRRLAGKQREICRKEIEIVEEVANGAKLALAECQYQFSQRRWNCTTAKRTLVKILRRALYINLKEEYIRNGKDAVSKSTSSCWDVDTKIVTRYNRDCHVIYELYELDEDGTLDLLHLDTRESSFVYAITAAGVVYAVTQACSMGKLLQCSCDNNEQDITTDGEWKWGGCGDNVKFGYTKSKEFMDAIKRKRRGDIRTRIQLHNNEAGRLAVKLYMRTECKCHGLSGSCTLKTCWRRMPLFREVGSRLKERFDGAAKVIGSNDGKRLIPEGDTIKPPTKQDLIYSENSVKFCKRNKKAGSLGTKGRECDPFSMGVSGCDLLCCHRGYTEISLTVSGNCKCRFIWCCNVTCETCVSEKIIYRCL